MVLVFTRTVPLFLDDTKTGVLLRIARFFLLFLKKLIILNPVYNIWYNYFYDYQI